MGENVHIILPSIMFVCGCIGSSQIEWRPEMTVVKPLNKLPNKEWKYLQFSSVLQSCPTLCDPMNRSTPGLPVHHKSRSSHRLTSIESMMPSSHLILGRPLPLLPLIPPSIRVFSNEPTLHMRWPVLEFQL